MIRMLSDSRSPQEKPVTHIHKPHPLKHLVPLPHHDTCPGKELSTTSPPQPVTTLLLFSSDDGKLLFTPVSSYEILTGISERTDVGRGTYQECCPK